jgi:hypothetical protein
MLEALSVHDNSYFSEIVIELEFENRPPFKLRLDGVKSLSIMIGQNGVGKTMALICTWFMGNALTAYQSSLILGSKEELYIKTLNDIISMTFDDYETMSGFLIMNGPQVGGYEFILRIENGEVVDHDLDFVDVDQFKTTGFSPFKFLSSSARLFTDYKQYQATKKMIGVGQLKTMDDIKKLGTAFKMYDILWYEDIEAKMRKWQEHGISDYAKSIITDFHTNWPSDHDEFGPNPTLEIVDAIPWIKSDTVHKKLSAFGNGHQSVLMMTLFIKN